MGSPNTSFKRGTEIPEGSRQEMTAFVKGGHMINSEEHVNIALLHSNENSAYFKEPVL